MMEPTACLPPKDMHEAASQRRLDCVHAGTCLTTAVRHNWPAFTCGKGCYEPLTPFERLRDAQALSALRIHITQEWPE